MQQQQQQQQQQVQQQLPIQQPVTQTIDQNQVKTANSIWKEAQLSVKNKEIPSARWGHSFVKANNNQIYLFGGYAESNYMNDSWAFDLNTFQWKALINQAGIIPEKRSNHTGCYLEKRNKIVIFGGGGKEKKRFNDIHLLDINTHAWEQMHAINGEIISPRTYHTANLFFDQYIAIFGGEGVGDLNDLYILCLEPEPQWIVLQPSGRIPPKRRFHSSAVVQNKLYILGGCFSNYRCHDDIWELNLGQYLSDSSNTELEWKQILHYNHVFQPRWGQCSQVYDDKIYIFGGRNLKDLNETIIFDPSKQADCLVKIDQTSPNPRRRGAAVVVGSTIIVFGGFDGVYYNDIHYLNITQTENEQSVKIDNEQHFKYLQSLMYSQQDYDLKIQFRSFQVGMHKVIVVERMNDPKNREFLNQIESIDTLHLYHKDFEQRFFINTVVQYMYSGVFDYRQIRNQKDLNQLQEFAYEIKLFTLLDALNQSEQWIRQEIQQPLVQRFNNYYFQRYFRQKQLHKKLIQFINFSNKSKDIISSDSKNKVAKQNSHTTNRIYDSNNVIVNDSIWFEDNEIFYQYCNILLQCEGKQIRVNKLLLSTQSYYFKTLFELGFLEKTEQAINIEIVSYNTLRIILNFIYYHKIIIPQNFEINEWIHLVSASKYFQIVHIQEICELELVKMINTDNIFNLYYSSILYNCTKLRQNCSQYFAFKIYETSIFINTNPMDFEDEVFQQMAIESEKIYQLLKFQINQDLIINELSDQYCEKIEIEQDNSQICQNTQIFIADVNSWKNQEQIIQKLQRRNKQKSQNLNREYVSCNINLGDSQQNCLCNNNCEQSYYQLNESNSIQSTLHIYDFHENSCKNKLAVNYINTESEKLQTNDKCSSPLYQSQDFNLYKANKFSQVKQLPQQQKSINNKQNLSLNSTINNENSVCLSGRSHDSIQYGGNSNTSKASSDNCHSGFINADSEEYDITNNAIIDESQSYQQFQTSVEYSP